MFKGLFKKRKNTPSKIETWKKFELFELFNDLDKVKKTLSKLYEGDSEVSENAKKFYQEFLEELNDLKYQNVPDFERICIWFAPNSSWNYFNGIAEIELGNRIYERANNWSKANNYSL